MPLAIEAQTEARMLMLASNILAGRNDDHHPSQDMVLGAYYTAERPGGGEAGVVMGPHAAASKLFGVPQDGHITLRLDLGALQQ